MNPSFAKNDLVMFNKYLDKANNYLEFGSGGSTYQASIKPNIKLLISVESDKDWFSIIKEKVKHSNFHYKFIDLKCKPNNWGYPSELCNKNIYKDYSNSISHKISKEIANTLDLILIDGRFRVACALKCHSLINDDCKIIFDDFLDRKHYHIVLTYYDIIDKTTDNRMVVLKKKKINIPLELINKYENIPA
jgi:hypothetical protein